MSSSSDRSKQKTWILVVLGILVIAFVSISVLPFLSAQPSQDQANNPSSPQQLTNLADRARGYEAVLEKEPNNQNALQGLLQVRIEQGDIESALVPLEKLADLNPEQSAYRILLAQAKVQTGDIEGASEAYRTILDEQPGNLQALQGLVDLFLQQNRPEAAIAELKDTLELAQQNNPEIDPTSIKLLLAQVYGRTEQFEGAIALYEEVANDTPGDFRPVLGQALIQQRMGNDDIAKPLYEKAFNLAPPQYKDRIQQMTPLLTDENTTPESETTQE